MSRLTKREKAQKSNGEECVICNHEKADCNDSCMYGRCKWNEKAIEKLKAYEDKQEQGLLIELSPIEVLELQDTARALFDNWNNTTGAIPNGTSWYYEALGVIEDIVKFAFGAGVLYKVRAEEMLK